MKKTRTLFIILDGAAGHGRTALSVAKMPNLDFLAENSLCGLWSGPYAPRNYNIKNMSSIATLELLGYSYKDDPGRGFLEALGIGLKPRAGDVYLRANFATVNKDIIVDRRAGRDYKGLDVLTEALNKKIRRIENIKTRFYHGIGHRGVLVLSGPGLSKNVSDADVEGKKIQTVIAHDEKAKKTARVINEYLRLSSIILGNHPINKKRRKKANYLLLRAAGARMHVESFSHRYGLKACSISGVSIIKGISHYLGIDVIDVPGIMTDFETHLTNKTNVAIASLNRYDFVLFHINGADICGHDRNLRKKVRFLEMVDREAISKIIEMRSIGIVITSDHETPCSTGEHRFGPVPLLIYTPMIESNDIEKFDEVNCKKGFITDNVMEALLQHMR